MRPAVFLDREGTINEDVGYLDRLERLTVFPYSIDAVRLLNGAGFCVVVVTNQRGVATGLISETFLHTVHDVLTEQFRIPLDRSVIELPAGLVGDDPGSEGESVKLAGALDAPDPRPSGCYEEQREAVEGGSLAAILNGKEGAGAVGHPVARSHQAAGDKGSGAGEETDHHKRTSHQLDRARNVDDPRRGLGRRNRKAEEFLQTVGKEEKSDHDAQQRIRLRLEALQSVHSMRPPAAAYDQLRSWFESGSERIRLPVAA